MENKILRLQKLQARIKAEYLNSFDSKLKLKIDKLQYCIIYLKTKSLLERTSAEYTN